MGPFGTQNKPFQCMPGPQIGGSTIFGTQWLPFQCVFGGQLPKTKIGSDGSMPIGKHTCPDQYIEGGQNGGSPSTQASPCGSEPGGQIGSATNPGGGGPHCPLLQTLSPSHAGTHVPSWALNA
jgi:hypothetical protein